MQVHNVRVKTVSGMSTRVDFRGHREYDFVETVSGISTKVDSNDQKRELWVKAVREMSADVDSEKSLAYLVETVRKMSTRVDCY